MLGLDIKCQCRSTPTASILKCILLWCHGSFRWQLLNAIHGTFSLNIPAGLTAKSKARKTISYLNFRHKTVKCNITHGNVESGTAVTATLSFDFSIAALMSDQ